VKQIGDRKPFVTSGSRGWAEFYSDRGSLFVRITNMTRDSIYLDLENPKFVNLPVESSEGIRTQLQEHDVLVSITADIGIISYVDSNVPTPAYINQHIALVRFDQEKTCGKFVSYFLASEKPQKLFRSSTDTGAKAGMSLPTVQKLAFALPPLPEQRAIATALSDVDALLAALDRLIAKQRDLKQAAMQQLLTGQTRLPGFTGKWETKRVLELGDVVTGGTPRTDFAIFWGDGYPWITPTDISAHRDMFTSERTITRKGLDSIRALPPNTVLVTCIASIGKNAILRTAGACNQQINAVTPNKNNSAEFLYYLFEASKQYLQANAGTTATSIISKAAFAQLTFTVPPLPEQTAIATVLSDMDLELAALEQRRDKTRALKQGMMQELLTGRTRLL
jgi:type I restriction enzyme S subunit